MKLNTLVLTAIMAHLAIINTAAAMKDVEREANDIAAVLPIDFANYKKQLTGNNDFNDCKAIIWLVMQAKAIQGKSLGDANEQESCNIAYYSVWRLSLRMRQNSKEQSGRELILDQWNNVLRKDDFAVPFQILALRGELWDRSYLTDDFWALLQRTNKKKTITAICVILSHGDAKDLKRLEQKRDSGINVQLADIIQNAINWMHYNFSRDRTDLGPAAAPPHMDMRNDRDVVPESNEIYDPNKKYGPNTPPYRLPPAN